MVTKGKFSFKGYNMLYALKDELKEVLRVGVPLVVGWVATKGNVQLTAIVTALGTLAIKGFEYFVKKNEVKEKKA